RLRFAAARYVRFPEATTTPGRGTQARRQRFGPFTNEPLQQLGCILGAAKTPAPPRCQASLLPRTKSGVHTMNRSERTLTTEQIRLERRLPSYWLVTFDIPPLNIFGPKRHRQFHQGGAATPGSNRPCGLRSRQEPAVYRHVGYSLRLL